MVQVITLKIFQQPCKMQIMLEWVVLELIVVVVLLRHNQEQMLQAVGDFMLLTETLLLEQEIKQT